MRRKLLIGITLSFCCWSCSPVVSTPVATEAATVAADPASMTYQSTWHESGKVILAHGVFREPAAPGSAAELVVRLSEWQAFDGAGAGKIGAVILVTQPGGTGSFHDLALLRSDGSTWVNSDLQPLGDRVRVHGLALREGQVIVDLTTHGPRDPQCCPTLRVARRFAVKDGKLLAAGETAIAAAAVEPVGPVWRWVESRYNNDTTAAPPRPGDYTVQFAADGMVNIRADCNQKGGRYSIEGQQIAIEITHSTMAACPDGSLEGQFVRDLAGGAIWFLKDGDLYIDIRYDTGTMRLSQ